MDTRLERDAMRSALDAFEAVTIDVGDRKQASVVLAVGGTAGSRHVLLTKRPPRMRAHAGQFALPGGRVDPGESAVDAALRELEEEVGVRVGPEDVLGVLDDYATRSGYVIRPFVVWAGGRTDELVLNPDEVEFLFRVDADELDVDVRFVTIAESDRRVVQWPFRSTLVHAPTAAVIHQFREVVMQGRPTRVADYEQPVFAWT